jgi:serine/threonine-protein kinase
MAPEQIRSQPVDHRADVWALGVVLWEATTGKRLFRTDAHGSTVLNVVDMAVPRPTRMFADYPPALEAAILGALTRDPTKRTQSAGKLAEQLEEYLYASGRPAGANQVAAWMKAHFADKLDKRDAILRDATSDVGGPVPEIELESESSIASRVRGTDSSARAEAIPVALPDTQADVVLPEARTGLAVPPPQDDDDDGATVIADPPVMAEAVAPPPVMAGLERDPRDFEALTSPDEPAATVRSPSLPEMERARRRSGPPRPYAGPPPPPPTIPLAPAVATPDASATSTGRHAPVDGSASPRPPPIATPFSPTARPEGSVEPAVIFGAIGVIGFLLLLIAIAVVLAVTSSDSAPETDTDATTESAHSQ